ncbi:uncharacterized protein BYT42DRAFT_180711 [Radiomyces spectabilis]|uniref:uncharacterized protein n=1 Tax=Radiomyces spectabilis TaxID=64574 RepID=UPI0022201CB5|nr:uncharacterized protein BYT42DRAFT_180711 [Radiomyces spectabilis]KAI8391056.1 hypothetical protein BYT42DRAFT_180711 [Radiomyces spectabilis]
MDSYLHTPLASSTMLSRSMPATSHMMKPPIRAIPESNPDVDCKALLTPDGTYRLQQEVYFSTIPPQYATGTHASLIENERKKSPSQGSCDAGVARTFSRSPAFEGLPEHTEPVFHVGGEEENGLESDAGPGILPQLLLAENKDIGSPGINITTPYNVPTLADPDIPTASRTLTRSSSMSSTDGSSDLSPSPLSHSTSVASTNSYFPEIMSPTNSRRFPNSYVDIERSQTMFLSTTRETNADDDHLPITQTFSHGWSVGSFSSFSHHGSHHHAHHHHHHHNHNHHHPSRHHIKRPKNSLIKSKSSLIERVVVYEQLPKVLASRSPRDRYLFFNVGSNFIWMDANDHPKEPLTRIVFSGGHPTCHDVNAMTMSDEHMDVIIGFSSGDFIWYDPINTRYSRLNKNVN